MLSIWIIIVLNMAMIRNNLNFDACFFFLYSVRLKKTTNIRAHNILSAHIQTSFWYHCW